MGRACAILILFFINSTGFTQNLIDSSQVIDSAEVRWMDQFPSKGKKQNKKKQGLTHILSRIAGVNNNERIELNKPMAIFAKSPEDIWVLDQGNANLFQIKNGTGEVPRVFTRKKIEYQSLVGMCSVPDKGILFTDSRMNKIFFLKNDLKTVSILSDSLVLKQPTGIAFYPPQSEIWVVETAAHCITILDETGKKIRSFGSRGAGNGEFNFPTSIWIDENGFAYVVDALNYRIQIFDQKGNFVNSFGKAGNASGYFAMPKGIATDSYGNIYVTDALFHIVQIFDKQGNFLDSFGSQGREAGELWMPSGIFIDKQNIIYVADSYNSRIQLFNLMNIVKKK
jgi:hypothetical protein